MKKRLMTVLAVGCIAAGVAAGSIYAEDTKSIIEQAQEMTLEELAAKAIEESNGATFYGVGNSSRGKTALPTFIEYLQTIDPSYNMEFDWQQPKNNKIFEQLQADSLKPSGTFAMTLIQDGNQIQSKMADTGILDTFIPKEWAEANGVTAADYDGFLELQLLNKVFMYNCTGDKVYDNCWDFVAEGSHPLFMGVDSEIVGKNFVRTALMRLPILNSGSALIMSRPMTARSARPWWMLPLPISPAFLFIPSFVLWKSPLPFLSTTSRLRLMKTVMKASADTATAIICS